MQDVLALCSGGIPSWCHQLTKACPFLFLFETRRQYFYSTAFGLSRALNWIQQQQGANVPLVLFPRPWPVASDSSDGSLFAKVIDYFRLLGCVMAKAPQDGRLLDLPLSTPFYKLVLGQAMKAFGFLVYKRGCGDSIVYEALLKEELSKLLISTTFVLQITG
ncbi:hypothetical protein L1987_38195 [Smallanthus sonchifolius]|uniref:Uncharacterized protein n=1 Tax=Smallanthus sonchifolius TaxID=185202 RepID=A0ACB9HII4_9ASTR|nr:hypothetical protein L1987_38195 [Smallanthus sonchifolius]